eukprot:gene26587-biopygen16940
MLRKPKADASDGGGVGLGVRKFGWLRHPNLLTPSPPPPPPSDASASGRIN